jgi:hypothetical protein
MKRWGVYMFQREYVNRGNVMPHTAATIKHHENWRIWRINRFANPRKSSQLRTFSEVKKNEFEKCKYICKNYCLTYATLHNLLEPDLVRTHFAMCGALVAEPLFQAHFMDISDAAVTSAWSKTATYADQKRVQ